MTGLTAAADELGVDEIHVESIDETDYAPNIDGLIAQGCTLIVAAGNLLSAAVQSAADANPDVEFAVVSGEPSESDNVRQIGFRTEEAAFLAGYAAASYSQTGVVGTFGGVSIPPVNVFLDGFAQGVLYYNEEKGTDVSVLGWNIDTQDGSFTGGFTAGIDAKNVAQALIDQDVDVLFPVGGPIYQSAAEAIRDSGRGIALIGVDVDMYDTDPSIRDILLTSVLNDIGNAVKAVVADAEAGNFTSDPFLGALKNGGVGIAPFHDFADKVNPGLQAELDALQEAISSGEVVVVRH